MFISALLKYNKHNKCPNLKYTIWWVSLIYEDNHGTSHFGG